ncbi:hypothetical protein [uncultured Aquimarina sp.]|uniref:HNH endonuclease n=1 Tax=uncultured Aquimarina sp. TaxID=575652 RepID=UPI0026092203|nr:hypothetical protein [uncultured Aquimarina sp.]
MKTDINDSLLRQAIWESYKRICYYSKEPIKINEMELDHVIPKFLLKKPLEKTKVFESLNLPLDFDILDIKNIVPCTFEENRKKGTNILSNTTSILGDIKCKLKVIEKIYWKLKKEQENSRSLSYLSESVKSGELSPEESYNFITNIKPIYDKSESYLDDFFNAHFSSSTERVFLNGFLPRPNKKSASCCVSFKSIEIRGVMITLTEEKVIELTNLSHRKATLQKKTSSIDFPELKNTVFFNYNGVNFFLDVHEINEFYDLLDRYKKKIEVHKQKLDEYYGVGKFKLSKSKNGYRLGKIKRRLWFLMLKFANEHDYDSGNTSWHMFDSNDTRLRVNSGRNINQKYNEGFHASFIPEQIENTDYFDFMSNDDQMWLVWNQSEPNSRNRDFKNYSIKNVWNAEMSYQWIKEEFIPYIIWSYEVSKKDKILKYRSYERYKSNFEIDKYIWL